MWICFNYLSSNRQLMSSTNKQTVSQFIDLNKGGDLNLILCFNILIIGYILYVYTS